MIWNALVTIVFSLLTWFLNLMPDFTAPEIPAVTSALNLVGNAFEIFDDWVNVGAFLAVIAIGVTVSLIAAAVRLAVWVYDRIPFKAT